MKYRASIALCASLVLTVGSAAFGIENQPAEKGGNAIVWVTLLAPAVFFLVFLVLLARRSGSFKQGAYLARAADHMVKSEEHMANMERKADRMVQLLESIDRRLSQED